MSKPNLSRAVFPGSFDPFTNGHYDVVERALKIFDEIIVAVLSNPDKACVFEPAERVKLIQNEFKNESKRVKVASFSGLLVDFLKKTGSKVVIRGLRAISDFDYEAQMALTNRRLGSGVETLFLTTSEDNSYVSSSLVKQVARFGGDVGGMVPANIAKALSARFKGRRS